VHRVLDAPQLHLAPRHGRRMDGLIGRIVTGYQQQLLGSWSSSSSHNLPLVWTSFEVARVPLRFPSLAPPSLLLTTCLPTAASYILLPRPCQPAASLSTLSLSWNDGGISFVWIGRDDAHTHLLLYTCCHLTFGFFGSCTHAPCLLRCTGAMLRSFCGCL
jgi:hypothetical protein